MECRVAPPGQKPSSLASYLNFEDILRIRQSMDQVSSKKEKTGGIHSYFVSV